MEVRTGATELAANILRDEVGPAILVAGAWVVFHDAPLHRDHAVGGRAERFDGVAGHLLFPCNHRYITANQNSVPQQ